MALISLKNVSIRFGGQHVLDNIEFMLEAKDRACLVGRNGEGKSTLLRLMNGDLEPDSGSIVYAKDVKVAYLPQHMPQNLTGTIREIVVGGLSGRPAPGGGSAPDLVQRVLSLVKLEGGSTFDSLSGGLKRRALLAKALVANPDVLLLDEPTNHLDIESIEWLEGFLRRYPGTLLFVTHDRMFLRRLAQRIVDLDRGGLSDWRCDYDTFLGRKDDQLQDEAARNLRFDKKLTKEEVWIRQGIKARRTRDEGRVRALKEMRNKREARRTALGIAKLQLQEAGVSGKLVVKAQNVVFAYNGDPVINELTTTIIRGDKVGIIGPNGCGKTTLLRLLLGPHAATDDTANQRPERLDHRTFTFELSNQHEAGLQPQTGTIRRGTRLEVAYFDQHRHELDEQATVFDNVANGSDTVVINGQQRNLFGYLQDFLFTPDRTKTPIHVLSGGERNRLLLAKLFAQPANLLVMDEPTNDLDAETLALLEERLVEYSGTLLLVSHDREFLNNVVTSTLVFEEPARVHEYVGGYDDWLRQRPSKSVPTDTRKVTSGAATRTRRLTYAENRELGRLPEEIEKLETEQAELHRMLADAKTYQQPGREIAETINRMKGLEQALLEAYERWEALEAIKNRGREK